MSLKALGLMFLIGTVGYLTGCYQDEPVTLHEPAVYKGQHDPLLDKDPQTRAETLSQRFMLVQTDR